MRLFEDVTRAKFLFLFCIVIGPFLPARQARSQCLQVNDVTGSISYPASPQQPPAYNTKLVFDSARNLVVGVEESSDMVWKYNGASWTSVIPPPHEDLPPLVNGAAWVYDSVRHVSLYFGGVIQSGLTSTNGLYSHDTIAWKQLTWTGVSPPAAQQAYGAFDTTRGRAIFLIYTGNDGANFWETWEWTGSAWEQGPSLTDATPDSFVFASLHGVGFLSGKDPASINEAVWLYIPGATAAQSAWTSVSLTPPPFEAEIGATLAYDPYRDRVIRCFGRYVTDLYGFDEYIYTWDWANTNWVTSVSHLPAAKARAESGAAYDLNRDVLVIYGGLVYQQLLQGGAAYTYYTDTWEQTDEGPGIVASSTGNTAQCMGETAVFSVTSAGNGVSYQWFHNGTNIPGATFSLLVLNNLGIGDTGDYFARVSNNCGYIDTPLNYLRVDQPITIFRPSSWPLCPFTCIGNTISIIPPEPVDTGIPLNIHLQELVSGTWTDVRVSSPSAPQDFVFTNIQKSFTGDYRFYIDGSTCPGIAEQSHHIQVGFNITSPPDSANDVQPCSVVTFSVGATGGCNLTYHWASTNRGALSDDGHFSGTKTPTLTINGAHYDDEGAYYCTVVDTGQCFETIVSPSANLLMALPQWVLRATNGPSARDGNAMAYDSQRGVTVMFGGGMVVPGTGYVGFGDLWEWDGARWHQRTSQTLSTSTNGTGWIRNINGFWRPVYANIPVPRLAHAMAYDSRRGRVVMFGGRSLDPNLSDQVYNDTWEWDGTNWLFRTTNGPPARFYAGMAYDSNRAVTVLTGGFGASGRDVWEWDGTNWALTSPTNGPTSNYNQYGAGMDYDGYAHQALFGPTTDGFSLQYFWGWDGQNWQYRGTGFTSQLYPPQFAAMIFDGFRNRSLYFGGQNASGGPDNHTAFLEPVSGEFTPGWGLYPDAAQSSLFSAKDFVNIAVLVTKLGTQIDPVSQYLWGQLSPATQQTLTNLSSTPDQQINALAPALNTIITQGPIYDATRFAGVGLSMETSVFKALNPSGNDLVRLNRLLIEDAYTVEIGRSFSTPPSRMQHAMAFDSARHSGVLTGGLQSFATNGLVGSDTWELLYLDTPIINQQPASQYRAPGDTAVFSINARAPVGTPVTYAWFFGGQPLNNGGRISGAHSPTLSISNVNTNDVGQYQVRISANCGTASSVPAILTTQPSLQIFPAASTFTLVWPPGNVVLEQADSIAGPWTVVPGATPPYDVFIESPSKFFRLNTAGP